MEHFAHYCSSTLLETTGDGTCSLCFKETFISYSCNACGFDLCKSCFKLSDPTVIHVLHPQHPLHFHLRQSGEKPQSFICCGCGYVSSGSYYECRECEIKIDLECVSKEITKRWNENSIYHYSHRHMLSLCRPGRDFSGSCLMCERHVSDMTLSYGCVYCLCFIHEWCIDLPREIQHPVHSPHPLRRLNYVQHGERRIVCNACQDIISGVPFGCVECKFNLHIGCADSLLRGLKHESHPHGLFYVARNASYAFSKEKPCHVCKGIGKFFKNCYYCCMECDLNFHFECLKLPTFLASKSCHPHPLWCKAFDESCDYYCDLCETMINSGVHAYCCKECEFYAHIECIFRKEEPSPMYLKCLYPDGEDVERARKGTVGGSSGGDSDRNELKIVDVTHTHLLQSFDEKGGVSHTPCAVCNHTVGGRAYRCVFHMSRKCEFVAHEACAKLGQQLTRRFHTSHPLALLPVPPTENMECDMCKRAFKTFNLFCRTCDYAICLSCAIGDMRLVQKVTKGKKTCIDGHNLVQFFERSGKIVDCSICEEDVHGKASACSKCKETYHDQCLQLLGHMANRPSDPHRDSLRLRRFNGQYCGDCKLKIRRYGYVCTMGHYGGFYHVKCPEASLKVECHDHNLRYSRAHIESGSETTLECSVCTRPCNGTSFYGCDQCGFGYHVECLGLATFVKYKGWFWHILSLRPTLPEMPTNLSCDHCECPCDPLSAAYKCELCDCVLHIECLLSMDDAWKALTGEDRALELRKSLHPYDRETQKSYCTKKVYDARDMAEWSSAFQKSEYLMALQETSEKANKTSHKR